jgi:hypothetical protein
MVEHGSFIDFAFYWNTTTLSAISVSLSNIEPTGINLRMALIENIGTTVYVDWGSSLSYIPKKSRNYATIRISWANDHGISGIRSGKQSRFEEGLLGSTATFSLKTKHYEDNDDAVSTNDWGMFILLFLVLPCLGAALLPRIIVFLCLKGWKKRYCSVCKAPLETKQSCKVCVAALQTAQTVHPPKPVQVSDPNIILTKQL